MGPTKGDQDFKLKQQEVFIWLDQQFGDEPVPQFEVNPKTIKILHQLVVINGRNDKIVQLLLDDLRQKTMEYNAEAQRLEHVMSKMDMCANKFSQAGLSSLRTLAHLGKLLHVKDASDTCYILSMQDLQREMYEVTEQLEKENKHLHLLSTKSHSALIKHSSLQTTLETVQKKAETDQALNSKRMEDTVLMKRKSKEYIKDVVKIKAHFEKSGAHKSIFHDTLVKTEQTLKDLQGKLDPLKKELQAYSSLPPDLMEAKIKIEQLKRELAEVAKQMSAYMDPRHT